MGKNKRKFAFIICTNNEQYFHECCLYINQLRVPSGFTVDIVPVYEARSMTSGYNDGMNASDAQYKIYMHQDVSVINPNFLYDILTVFQMNRKIAMIGMIGSPTLPPTGVMWHGERVGNLYQIDANNVNFDGYEFGIGDEVTEVEAIDGLMMITKEDIPWRSDLFDGWDFYDISQSFEFRKRGLKVVVPKQRHPWCAHDDEKMNLWGYNKYRQIFIKEYM